MSYRSVMERVATASARSGRDASEITVVAVSKTFRPTQIHTIHQLGHRDFGENRAQELAAKAPELPGDIRWHFVGSLQTNKVRSVRGLTHLLHSMDRRSLGSAWMKGRGTAPPVLLQVNLGAEPQKAGVTPDRVGEALEWMLALGLDVRGVMAIPPQPETAEDSRPHFTRLREIRDRLAGLSPTVCELSMGMSDDFEVAIEEGSTIIRIGRAIFGPRNPTGA